MGVIVTLVFVGFSAGSLSVCSGVGDALGVAEDRSGFGEAFSLGLSEGLGLWVGTTDPTS